MPSSMAARLLSPFVLMHASPTTRRSPRLRASRRLRKADFFAQAGWFDFAQDELDRLLTNMPQQKDRVEAARKALLKLRVRDQLEEIKRHHLAGQHQRVRKELADFSTKGVPEKMVSEFQELRAEYETTDQMLADTRRLLDEARRQATGADSKLLIEAAAVIRNGDVAGGTAKIPSFGRITDNGAWTAWFGHLVPQGSTILNGTLIRHGFLCGFDESSPQRKTVRARRIFCSNRNARRGCGRTFSVWIADKIRRRGLTPRAVLRFRQRAAARTLPASIHAPDLPLSHPPWPRTWTPFRPG